MDIWGQSHWFAIHTRAYKEGLAAARLVRQDFEVFLPYVKRKQLICGASRWLTKPLFPGYFFARFVPCVAMDVVRYTPGVLRILGSTRFPLPVAPELISEIQRRTGTDGLVLLEDHRFQPGEEVRVEQGPFEGFMGKVEREWDDGKRVMILLEAIQQARLLVEKRWLATV